MHTLTHLFIQLLLSMDKNAMGCLFGNAYRPCVD
uniref:Uncharacterized protein n=1 Tax=Arundo donax TaxID=35708 RepID=A0A0A9I2X2_ARUDO